MWNPFWQITFQLEKLFFLVFAHKLLQAHVVKRLDQKYVTALAKYVYLPLPWHNVDTKFSVISKILD